jgi:hypothetical protein
VFTLEPGALFAEGSSVAHLEPEKWAAMLSLVLLDDEPPPDAGDGAPARGTATSHPGPATSRRSVETPNAPVPTNARLSLLADLSREITSAALAAGLDQDELGEWVLDHVEDSIGRMPYLGRLLEVIGGRLGDSQARWGSEELNDAHFLACAAAYADVVVGESETIEYLRRATGRCVPGAYVCTTFPAAHEHIAAGGLV